MCKEDPTVRATVIRATTDSPMSPPPVIVSLGKSTLLKNSSKFSAKSLLDIWYARSTPRDRRPEFHGRLNSDGPRAKLYPNLKEHDKREARGEPVIEA